MTFMVIKDNLVFTAYCNLTPVLDNVTQICVLSPELFNLYMKLIMRSLHNIPEITVDGHGVNNL